MKSNGGQPYSEDSVKRYYEAPRPLTGEEILKKEALLEALRRPKLPLTPLDPYKERND
jgi:hypothetical protein